MPNSTPQHHIQLFGKRFSLLQIPEIQSLLEGKYGYADWILYIVEFLKDWQNNSATITVKTSGTTGTPKTILLSKKAMAASARNTIEYFKLQSNTHAALVIPCSFIAGKMMLVRAILGNWNLMPYPPSGDLEQIANRIDFIAMLPNQLYGFLQLDPSLTKNAKVLLGGSTLSQSQKKKLYQHPAHFYHSYASTETASHVAIKKLNINAESFEAMNGVHFSTDKNMCLKIHADYLDENEIQTRDVVKLFDDTHFEWLGRADNIINSGGIKVQPELLESKIAHLLPGRFYIKGVSDTELGQKIVLIIEADNTSLNKEKLLRKLNKSISGPSLIKDIQIVRKLHLTKNGKIKRS